MQTNGFLKIESDPLSNFSDMNSNYPLMMSSTSSLAPGVFGFDCDSSLGFMELLNGQADFGASVLFEQLLAPANVEISQQDSITQLMNRHYHQHQAETSSEVLNNNAPTTPNSSSIVSTETSCSGEKKTTNDEDDDDQQGLEETKKLTKKQLKPKKTSLKRQQREPRIAFMTKTEVDHLEDGYRWRKYGQKAVKNSPFPRSYYRCTSNSCNVKKRVERSFNDPSMVVTTYEGQHTHQSPLMPRPSHEMMANATLLCSGSSFPELMGHDHDQSHHHHHFMNSFNYGHVDNLIYSGGGAHAHQLRFISEPNVEDRGLLVQDVKN